MFDQPEPTLPILLLGVVFHDARYVEDLDELQLWRWPTDAGRAVRSERLPDGDLLLHDEHDVLVGLAIQQAARRARLRLPIRLGDRYRIPPTVLRDLIYTATVVEGQDGRAIVADDAARELRGLLDAVSDLVAGSAEELTASELIDLHDRLLAAVAEWADPLGIRPFDAPPPVAGDVTELWQPPRRFDTADHGDDARATTLHALSAWADGERDHHPLSDPPVSATDAQLLAVLHHARRAEIPVGSPIHLRRRDGLVEVRMRGVPPLSLDAAGRPAASTHAR